MGQQMQEYAVSQVLHWFRRFDDYQAFKQQSHWEPLPDYQREDFTIGILGAGVLGSKSPKRSPRGASHCAAGAGAVRSIRASRALPERTNSRRS